MIHRFASARSRVAAAVTIGIAAVGCDAADSPPALEPRPSYDQIPRDLCDRVEFDAIAERFDLTVPPFPEHDSNYARGRNHWYEGCWFTAEARDSRFAPEVRKFDPSGPVEVEVFDEVADAKEAYGQEERGSLEYRAEQELGATTAALTGWWDDGISLEWLREPNPAGADPDQPPSLVVAHLIRHENLVVEAAISTLSAPTKDVAGALELLHDLAAALIDEAVDHLTLAG